MHSTSKRGHFLNIFFGEDSQKNKSFSVRQGDYNSNEVVCDLYAADEMGRSDQMDLQGMTVTVVFKKDGGKPTPEYTADIDDEHVGRVRFCIPQRILTRHGDAVFQLKIYGRDSLLNSVVIPFEIDKSIDDCGHEDGCRPVTLHVIQKVEDALEELSYMQDEFNSAEVERSEEFSQWRRIIEDVEVSAAEIVNAPTVRDFPAQGDEDKIYKAVAESRLYQWNKENRLYEPLISASQQESITIIHGGNAYGTD